MSRSLTKKILTGVSLAGIVLLIGWLVLVPVSAAPHTGGADSAKLDVGIFEGINEQGNPINEDAQDDTVFTFHVTFTTIKIAEDGEVISSVTQEVGYFTSHQSDAGEFPYMYGPPYHDTYCAGVKVLGVCVGTVIDEEGFYHVDHFRIPDGYCPQFPFGQDRHKDGTTTSNQKYFKDEVCHQLYPGFDDKFGYCPNAPSFRRCYILLR